MKRRITLDEAVKVIIERSEKWIAEGKSPKKVINSNRKAIESVKKGLRKYDACINKERDSFLWFEKKRKK